MIAYRSFQDLPIAHKLRTVILIISGLAVLGACAVFLTYQWVSSRNALTRQLTIIAQIVGDQSAAALEFGQAPEAAAILGSLRAERQVLVAAIYDRRGRLFAQYLREDAAQRQVPPVPRLDGPSFDRGDLLLFHPILSAGERIGTFHLRSDRSEAWHRLRIDLETVGLVLLGAAVAILLLARRLGGLITEPVTRLAGVVQAISTRRDYSLRAEQHGGDEIGRLIDGFNDMLAQVQARDEALARARDDLERRVQERTAELEEEVAERKATEADLAAVNHELESFSYSVSHDLRAPLRAIGGFSQMLREDYGDRMDAEGQRYLAVIAENTQRMGQLIDDLLAFSRMGRKAVEATPIDMEKLTHEVLAGMRDLHADRRIELEVGDLPKAAGDLPMVRQVLVNLISNAIKYSRGRDLARIEVGALQAREGTVYYVRDNGVGFDMKYASKLFGVFQRLHSTKDFEGTGVGLALVQRIVQRHGGRVWAESKPDGGATFYFTLARGAEA